MSSIVVLMSTYNGGKYIEEQLKSLIKQKDVNIKIFVRDDGSSDNTINILNKWQNKGLLSWYTGENLGPALSFMDLIKKAPFAEYYALCDQDDVWHEDKLYSAASFLSQSDEKEPALYFSRARFVDKELNLLGLSNETPSYDLGGVLLGNHAIGCTMVFNNRLIDLLKKHSTNRTLHDAWIIRVCLAVGGKVYFDNVPHIDYRQHGNNVVGVNKSKLERVTRLFKHIRKNKNQRLMVTRELLDVYSDMMPNENRELISLLANYNKSLKNKIAIIKSGKFRRDSSLDNLIFKLSIIIGVY